MLLSLLVGFALLAAPPVAVTVTAAAAVPASGAVVNLPTPQFRRYGIADGLPSSSVYAVVQDNEGAMWFGTKSGVARYDGIDFKVFRHIADDPGSLYNNGIASLLVDDRGRLWAGGLEAGLNRYEPASGTFRHWGHRVGDPSSLTSDKVWTLLQIRDGALLIATARGLDRMRPDGRGFEHVSIPLLGTDPQALGTVSALYEDANRQLWIACTEGVFRRDTNGQFHRVTRFGSNKPIDAWHIDGEGGQLRIASTDGLLLVGTDDLARPLAPEQLRGVNVLSSVRDGEGRLWVGSQRGLFLQQNPAAPVLPVVDQPVLDGNLPGSWVWTLYTDREGGLWVGLVDGGVAYLAPGWDHFSRYAHIPDDPTSLRDSVATAIARGHDGRIWVGQRAGRVDKLDPVSGAVEHVLSGLQGDVQAMTEDDAGQLWVVVPRALYRYAHGRLDTVDLKGQGLRHPLEVELGPDNDLYARSFGEGLFQIDRQTLAVTPVPLRPSDERAHWGSQMTLEGGVFWYAGDGGLWRLAADHRYFEPVPGVARDRPVNAFGFARRGLWLARPDGLEYYRYQGDALVLERQIKADDGWPSIDVVDLIVDAQGRLWLSGRDGLWRYDPALSRFRQLGLRDGLNNGEFYRGYARMPSGMIYAPTLGGVVGFNPAMADQESSPPPLAVTGVSLREPDALIKLSPPFDDVLQVNWRNRGLTVQARAFSYVDPQSNRYRFRLDGFDPGWVETGNRGERDFSGLAAGDYTLEIRAASADGEWGSLALPLRIHVQAPPWARWWAWLIYAAATSLLLWLFMYVWRRRLAQRHAVGLVQQQRQMAEQANAAKTQFLATLSHEIRTPMTGVLGMAELLLATPLSEQQLSYAETIQRAGDLLLKLLNDALDLARIEAGRMALDVAPFDPRALVDEVAQLESARARAKGLAFSVQIADDLPAWVSGDAFRIRQILFNLTNNAFKFTERGSVTLAAQRHEGGVVFSVSDTGPGIPEAAHARLFQPFEQGAGPQRRAGSGLGLAICRELASLMGGSIELRSRVAHGTTFRVQLPLSEVDAPPSEIAPTLPARHAGSRHVLLVEDDAIVAAVMCGLLQSQGHSVTYVGNGLGALAELSRQRFDVMLLDLDLPGVDGFQLARIVRQRRHEWPQPIIAISARSAGDEEQRIREVGMDGFLRKPLTGEQLAAILAELPQPAAVR
jgi:signal transduction histidine kinase/streptogramin lyase/BarA-like signal transduction histidine kinase